MLQDAERLLARMTQLEKTQLLRFLTRDLGGLGLGIEVTPDVCCGEPRIVRTRIPVGILEQARRLGPSEADILCLYPTLRAEDLANAWIFVAAHRDEIDRQIIENEAA
jgi:uncharacterized protein (DUF433 family)